MGTIWFWVVLGIMSEAVSLYAGLRDKNLTGTLTFGLMAFVSMGYAVISLILRVK